MPTKITFNDGASIVYIYNAYGSQIKQSISASQIQRSTEYMNGFQYSNGILNFFSTSEGYVQNTVSNGLNNFNYVYNYTDHLGNIRLSYGEDPITHTVKILRENNYYPFGLKHKNYNMSEKNYSKTHGGVGIISCPTCPKTYQYQYNGKEYQSDLDLNVTQMDFRQYDNATGRFNTVDALSEATYSNSPYHFANNNPIYFSDPTGLISKAMENAWIENSIGEVTVWQNDGNGNFDMVSGGGDSGGFVNAAGVFHSGDFTAFENLSNVTLRGDFRTFLLQIQNHVYTYSPFYSHIAANRGAQSGGGASGDPTYNNVNTGLEAFGIGWSTKEIMIQGAVADARGISMTKVNNVSNIRTLGATGAGYMKVVKGISTSANLLGAGMTIADGYENGFQAHHAADLGIQAAIYGIGASIPVAGWIIGGGYFLGDMYFQSTHNGMSITQYYLDDKR